MTIVALTTTAVRRSHALLRPIVFVLANEFSSTTRRKRPPAVATKYKYLDEGSQQHQVVDRGGLHQAFKPLEGNFDDYLKKASLSPWVPVPDPVARKMLDLAKAGPEDIHVELGSGDGRMNFHALDPPYSVRRSVGVDIDEKLVDMALERRSKRHPAPPNLEFHVQDLTQTDSPIWRVIESEATIITMYFVEDALRRLKPKLETALGDRKCRVVCCGYAMPGWEPHWVEVILDLPLYVYEYGTAIPESPRLTPAERAQMLAAEEVSNNLMPQLTNSQEAFPGHNSQFDDVEEIKVPLFDPNEMIDGHWDDFDEPAQEDLDGNPAISKWRQPE